MPDALDGIFQAAQNGQGKLSTAVDLTEDQVALAFADRHAGRLLFCHHAGSWYRWDGAIWRKEETRLAYAWARDLCREFASEPGSLKARAALGKAATAAGVERFAQADRVFAVTSDAWDRDHWLLGTPGGTVNLRTGELRAPDQADRITKSTAVAPVIVPECPIWMRFLEEATAGDQGLIRFLRQWCGYSLTGDVREHALLFIYGGGGNGKSVFQNTVFRIMGTYARMSAMETFTASPYGDKHPTDLAMLAGARFVCASETEEGKPWAEARINQMTGGDTISARFMRKDFFDYLPQFKLTIIGNHKPVLRNINDAARRRFNIVPFLNKPAVKDPQLEEKLRAEWPAILRWMIEGGLDWQKNGLVRPQVVLDATAEYFEEQDNIAQWLDERCDKANGLVDTNESLWASWSGFAKSHGVEPRSSKALSQALERDGFRKIRNTDGIRGRGFAGLRVRVEHYGDE